MRQVLIALDQLANALTGGMADETVSAHAYRRNWTWRIAFFNWVFNDPDHCKDSYESERLRAQLPSEYRTP